MNVSSYFSAEARKRHLEGLWLPILLVVALMAYGIYQTTQAELTYGGARFVASLGKDELITTGYLALITALFFPAQRIGLKRPETVNWSGLMPVLILLIAVFASWISMRLSLPLNNAMDNQLSRQVAMVTFLVGMNEEWIFRGLLMAALCHRFGLRNGALLALLCFGLAHGGNALNSEHSWIQLIQIVSTQLTGSVLVLTALATRSLIPGMLAHGIYDFMVVDMGELSSAGANPIFMAPMLCVSLGIGIYGLYRVITLKYPGATPVY